MMRTAVVLAISLGVLVNAGLCVCGPMDHEYGAGKASARSGHSHTHPEKPSKDHCCPHEKRKDSSEKSSPGPDCCCTGGGARIDADAPVAPALVDVSSAVEFLPVVEPTPPAPVASDDVSASGSGPPRPPDLPLHLRLRRLIV